MYYWARHFTLTLPIFTLDYKWVSAKCKDNLQKCGGWGWGATYDGLASNPRGFMDYWPEFRLDLLAIEDNAAVFGRLGQ